MGRYGKDKDKGKGNTKDKDKGKGNTKDIDDIRKRAIAKADELRKLDEHNPLEQAMKFDEVRKNPPKPGYMKVECFEAEDNDGNKCNMSKSVTPEGIKWIKDKPFFITDLHSAIEANIAACPSNVGPMILAEGIKLAKLKKDVFRTEKRRDENKMMVILMIAMVTISVGAGAFLILTFFG